MRYEQNLLLTLHTIKPYAGYNKFLYIVNGRKNNKWSYRKEEQTMKELLKKIKPETVMSVGLVVLGAAQMLLSNKKEQIGH